MAELAAGLGYSVALGAFVAGMLAAESGRASKVEHLVAPMRDVFAAIFFVSIGMTVDPMLALTHLPLALVVFVVVLLGQFVSVSVAGVLSGNGLRRSMTAGLALGQIGEFSFILATIGIGAKVVRPELQPILVTVAVLTAFTTPLSLTLAPRIVDFVDRALPSPWRRLLNLYEDWIQRYRNRTRREVEVSKMRRAIRTLVLDGVAFTALLVGTAIWHEKAEARLAHLLGLEGAVAGYLVAAIVILALTPLLFSAVKNTAAFSRLLADVALPSEGHDPLVARVSRHSLRVILVLAATLGLGVPSVAVLAPVIGNVVGVVLLSSVVLAICVDLYRSANALDHEFESGAETLASLMARQVSSPPSEGELSDRSLLPGLDHARTQLIREDCYAVDKTLGQVNLRARTGVTVIAIHRKSAGVTLPHGDEPLKAGDRLAMVGTPDSLGRAEILLAEGPDALAQREALVEQA
jgi:CPA2 family monovalent cation:H+ antiporter-2